MLLSRRAVDPECLRRLNTVLVAAAPWSVPAIVLLPALAAVVPAAAAAGSAGAVLAATIGMVLAAASGIRQRHSVRPEFRPHPVA